MKEANNVTENIIEISGSINDLSYYAIQLDAVLGAVEDLMEDVEDAIYKGWHKERTAELLVHTIGRKMRIIDMALRPLSEKMTEKTETASETAELMVKYLQSNNVPK